jgi:hypothetical protein
MSDDPKFVAPVFPFEMLLEPTGLLWLINATTFHPRGYAISIVRDDEGRATGWQLLGDGKDRWTYAEDSETAAMVDARFHAVQRFLK